jgi:hypothetical protein
VSHEGFVKGDLIEVTTRKQWVGTFRDFGTIRGTALDTRGLGGPSSFKLWLNSPGLQAELTIDLNYVDVKTVFAALVARGEVPGL